MATYGATMNTSLTAGEAIAVGNIVKIDTSTGKAVKASHNTVAAGVAETIATADGEIISVVYVGEAKVLLGETVTAGALLASNSIGRAVNAQQGYVDTQAGTAEDPVHGSYIIGQAKEAGATGEVITALIFHAGGVPTTLALS